MPDFLPSFPELFRTLTVYAIPVVLAITLHEAAHAYVANHFGDKTAVAMGRLTLNPGKHIDLLGTIVIPILLYVATAGAMLFGYAKPVPVQPQFLRNPRRDMAFVAAAGPGSNLVMAFLWLITFSLLRNFEVTEQFFLEMAKAGVLVNLVLFALNLLPVPPLDGGRILTSLLPAKQALTLERVEPFGFFVVLGLAVFGLLGYWIGPLVGGSLSLMQGFLRLLGF